MIKKTVIFISLLSFFLGLSFITSYPVFAEGSRDMIKYGGNRAYFEHRVSPDGNLNNVEFFTGGIKRNTNIYVYAKNGETIQLGSSAKGIGSGAIVYKAPDGTTGACGAGVGLIQNVNQEQAGPLPNVGGYTPCQVAVTAATQGIWTINFISPVPTAPESNSPLLAATAPWTQVTDRSWINAWDATVRNTSGNEVTGRVYVNYLPLLMGEFEIPINSVFYVQTNDGYRYSMNLNGMEPFGFILFANSKGYTDPSGNPLYRSVTFDNNLLEAGTALHSPVDPDSGTDVTHKIFFNPPDTTMPTAAPLSPTESTWLMITDNVIPVIQNFQFTPSSAPTTVLPGGQFSFSTNVNGTYKLVIDCNKDGIYGNANDRVIINFATPGQLTVPWDGKDSTGADLLTANSPFNAHVEVRVGEVHFPFLDPEGNPNGFILTRLYPDNDVTLYYNDSGMPPNALEGHTSIPSNPLDASLGVLSNGGGHAWGGFFGNKRGMDTWTYFKVEATTTIIAALPTATPTPTPTSGLSGTPTPTITGSVTPGLTPGLTPGSNPTPTPTSSNSGSHDIQITKDHSPDVAYDGDSIRFVVRVSNNSTDRAENVVVKDTLSEHYDNVTWTCELEEGVKSGECINTSGSGNQIVVAMNINAHSHIKVVINAHLKSHEGDTMDNAAFLEIPPTFSDDNSSDNVAITTLKISPDRGASSNSIETPTSSANSHRLVDVGTNSVPSTAAGIVLALLVFTL